MLRIENPSPFVYAGTQAGFRQLRLRTSNIPAAKKGA